MANEPESEANSQPNNNARKSSKERLFSRCTRVELELPDYGTIEVFPYISSGAMSAAMLAVEKKTDILRSILEESVVRDRVTIEELSNADWTAIAEHFLKTLDTEANFDSLIEEGASDSEAFGKCFIQSSMWKETEESYEKFRKSIESQNKPIIEAAQAMQRSIEPLFRVRTFDLTPYLESLHVRDPFREITQVAKELSTIKLPSIDFLGPNLDFLKSIENQFSEIQRIHDNHVDSMLGMERLAAFPVLENFKTFESLIALDSVVADSVRQTEASNAYFTSKEYLSPIRLRRDLRARSIDDVWLENVEHLERAIVVETISSQNAVDAVVRHRLEQFEREKRLDGLPDLERRVRALEVEQEEDLHDLLNRFAKRVARYDHRVFWIDYGSKFIPRPEAIGRSLLGNFIEGNARGRAFVGQEIGAGEGFIDIYLFANGKHYIIELKVVGCGWGIGKADLGLQQLNYYDERFESADLFLIVFDGRKSKKGRKLEDEYEIANGKVVKVITIPIYSISPTSAT